MTTDTTALQEQLAEALHYGQGLDDWGVANDDERGEALDLAAAVLPLVRATQADAWDEGVDARDVYRHFGNPYREKEN